MRMLTGHPAPGGTVRTAQAADADALARLCAAHAAYERMAYSADGHARAQGCEALQWQTPVWNEGAIRFYDRLGATRLAKQRYTLACA
jgi:ribosomal protein S18 acetylase RimI-like enzyme